MANQLAKTTGKGLSKFEKEMMEAAREEAAREKPPVGNIISTDGGRFTFQGNELPNPLSAIVVDYAFVNSLYEGMYDPDNVQPPVCFAAGMVEADLAPSPNSPKPQAEKCSECPHNKFGSADNGKGKACKNLRRLALLPHDPKVKLANAEPAVLKLSPTSLGGWAAYVNQLAKVVNRTPSSVITQFTVVRKGSYFNISSQMDSVLSEKDYRVIKGRREEVRDMLLAEPDFSKADANPAKSKSKTKPVKRLNKKK